MVMVVDMSPVSPEFTLISIAVLVYWFYFYWSHGSSKFHIKWLCVFCLFKKFGWIK